MKTNKKNFCFVMFSVLLAVMCFSFPVLTLNKIRESKYGNN